MIAVGSKAKQAQCANGYQYQNDYRTCVSTLHTTLQTDSNVTTASIDESSAESGTETSHEIFMLVIDDFVV